MVSRVVFVARTNDGIAFRRGDVMPMPPLFVSMLVSSCEWMGICSFWVKARITFLLSSSKA